MASRSKSSWSSPSRKEFIFAFSLFALLVLIFQSDFNLRFSSTSQGSWWGTSEEDDGLGGSQSSQWSKLTKTVPSITVSESNGLTMNDVRIDWPSESAIPQTTIVQHTQGALWAAAAALRLGLTPNPLLFT